MVTSESNSQFQAPPASTGGRGLTVSWFITMLLAVAVAVRILIGQNLLNQYVGYTSGTGFVGGRFHPATYLLVPVLALHIANLSLLPIRVQRRGRRHLIALLVAGAAVIIALTNGGQNAAAVVVDVIIAPLAMAYLLSQLNEEQRGLIYRVILWAVVLNLIPVFYEKLTGNAIFPRGKTEMFFRPQGYLDHPLTAGVAVFCTMWGLLRLGRRPAIDLALSSALFIQVLLLGVRLPLVVAAVPFILQILKLGRNSGTGKVASGFFLIVIPPTLFAIAVLFGWLDRFMALGLYDDKSAGSRLIAFDILASLNDGELWRGVSNEKVLSLLKQFNLQAIENSFVAYTLMAGLSTSILVHFAIIVAVLSAARRDIVFVVITVAIFLGTIMFSTKMCAFMIYLLLSEIVVERWERK